MKEYVNLRETDGNWSVWHVEDFGERGTNMKQVARSLSSKKEAYDVAHRVRAQLRWDVPKYLLG